MQFCRVLDHAHYRAVTEKEGGCFSLLRGRPSPFAAIEADMVDSRHLLWHGDRAVALAGVSGAVVVLQHRYPYLSSPLEVGELIFRDLEALAVLLAFIRSFADQFLSYLPPHARVRWRPVPHIDPAAQALIRQVFPADGG